MEKNFDKWNKLKKNLELNHIQEDLFFSNGDIWWSTVGINLGTESCGKGEDYRRPILILKKLSLDSFIAIPLTSKEKEGTWFCKYELEGEINHVMLYQIKMMHKSRLQRKIGKMNSKDFLEIKKRLKLLLNL